jgi:hypothetical protein
VLHTLLLKPLQKAEVVVTFEATTADQVAAIALGRECSGGPMHAICPRRNVRFMSPLEFLCLHYPLSPSLLPPLCQSSGLCRCVGARWVYNWWFGAYQAVFNSTAHVKITTQRAL